VILKVVESFSLVLLIIIAIKMPMLRAWLNPIFSTVPRNVRLNQGPLWMAFYAAINPMSMFKSPFYGLFSYFVVWWFFWNNNVWGVVRNEGETWEHDKWWWILRASLWAFFLNWLPLFFIYLIVLGLVKLSVSVRTR